MQIGNLLSLSCGVISGWAVINYNELQSENSTSPTGPLTMEQASLVISIENIGGLIGNFAILPLNQMIGVKRMMHILGLPLIVRTYNKHLRCDKLCKCKFFPLLAELNTHHLCTERVLFLRVSVAERHYYWCDYCRNSNFDCWYIFQKVIKPFEYESNKNDHFIIVWQNEKSTIFYSWVYFAFVWLLFTISMGISTQEYFDRIFTFVPFFVLWKVPLMSIDLIY